MFAAAMVVGLAACSKPAPKQDLGTAQAGETKVAVPGAAAGTAPPTAGGAGATDAANKLTQEEGTLVIEPPTAGRAGTEMVAKVIVTPTSLWKVNIDFPTKLTLEAPSGVTLAKTQLVAGGADKAKATGDAEAFEERRLAFAVKLTPASPGKYTVNGTFKFAVCDKDQCRPKKETIAIAVAAQ